jgi:hypothetical protein
VTTYVRASDVLERQSADRLVLLPMSAPKPLLLDRPGQLVWSVLTEPITLDELSKVLSDATGTPAATIRSDVQPLLDELCAQQAVRQVF